MKRLIIPLLFFAINIYAQNFQSVDTDTLNTIKDFGLRRYDRERERTLLDSKDISSNKIKTKTEIYKSQLRDGKNVESRIISHYSIEGFKTSEEWYNRDTTFREFKYDKWGNCTEELILNNRNEVKEKEVKEFDNFGNLIYHYSLKNGAEKKDMLNEELPNGERIVKDVSQTYRTSYWFDSTGVLKEYTLSYINTPKVNDLRRISTQEGVKTDTLFESDSGKFIERQKFSYNRDKLVMIKTFEEYERFLKQLTYTYKNNGKITINTVKWTDYGGLKNVRIFRYSNIYLLELIDSTIKPESEIYRTRFYYDDLGRLVQKKQFEKFSNMTRYYRDSLGREVSQRIYDESKNNDTLLQAFNIKYDLSGNIIQKSYYFKNTLNWQIDYKYNKDNKLTYYSYETIKPVIEVYYTYNDLGLLSIKKSITYTCTDCEYFDEEMAKSYPYVDIVKYDEYGNEKEFLRFKSQNILIDKTVSEYKDSLKIKTSRFKDNEEIFNTNFNYNEKGLLIYEQNQDFKGNSQNEISYQYEYYK